MLFTSAFSLALVAAAQASPIKVQRDLLVAGLAADLQATVDDLESVATGTEGLGPAYAQILDTASDLLINAAAELTPLIAKESPQTALDVDTIVAEVAADIQETLGPLGTLLDPNAIILEQAKATVSDAVGTLATTLQKVNTINSTTTTTSTTVKRDLVGEVAAAAAIIGDAIRGGAALLDEETGFDFEYDAEILSEAVDDLGDVVQVLAAIVESTVDTDIIISRAVIDLSRDITLIRRLIPREVAFEPALDAILNSLQNAFTQLSALV